MLRRLLEKIAPSWHSQPGATDADIQKLESEFNVILPLDYKQVLSWSNGGEGYIGSNYFSLWPIQEIKELNVLYRIDHYLPGIIGIGSDGGDVCYALDFRSGSSAPPFVHVPLGDLDVESVMLISGTLQEGIEKATTQSIGYFD